LTPQASEIDHNNNKTFSNRTHYNDNIRIIERKQ
jgi:hypothetical protein